MGLWLGRYLESFHPFCISLRNSDLVNKELHPSDIQQNDIWYSKSSNLYDRYILVAYAARDRASSDI